MKTTIDSSSGVAQRGWNAGGWFGGALGSSAWMLIVACFLIGFGQTGVAVVPFACFAVTTIASLLIWQCRDRMTFLSGFLTLIGVLAFTIPIAWLTTSLLANERALASMNWPHSPVVTAIVLFAAPAVGLWIALVESRRHTQTN